MFFPFQSCLPLEFPQFKSHKIEMDTENDDFNSRQDLYQNQKQAVHSYIPNKKVVYLNGFFVSVSALFECLGWIGSLLMLTR